MHTTKEGTFHKRSLHNCNKKKQEVALQPFFPPKEIHIAKQNMALGNDNKEDICIKAWSPVKEEQKIFDDHGVAMGSLSIDCLSNYY